MKEYNGKDLIDAADKVAEDILKIKRSNHHRDKFFPMLIDKMGLKIGAEIGVDKAEYTEQLLANSQLQKIYCIDSWMDDFGSDYRPGEYDPNGLNRMEEARKRLSRFEGRYEMIRATSTEAVLKIPDGSLDFCYIDGDHSLEMLFDLYAYYPKIRVGGICSGHDYKDGPKSGIKDYMGNQLDYKIKTCVDYFCQRYGMKLNIVGGRILSFWFVKNV